ncbi:MAG: DinB family protein [Anaerolineae bacterium]|nr:DinB family protein [Anaerolineae bacterium]
MDRSPLVEIRQKLRESRQNTLRLIEAIDEDTALFQPRPDAWCIKEHVVHIVAVEESIIHFAHRILNEECPISPLCYEIAFNQEAWNNREVAERAGYRWPEAVEALKKTHQELIELLAYIPEEALNRVGSHPIWGDPVTLASILRIPYRHERGHRDEIVVLAKSKSRPERS